MIRPIIRCVNYVYTPNEYTGLVLLRRELQVFTRLSFPNNGHTVKK